MKVQKHLKSLSMLLLVCCMALTLTACGGKDEDANNANNDSNGGSVAAALTEEEYQDAVTKLGEDFSAIQTQAGGAASDPDAAVALLEDMKAPLNEFIAIVPPEAYAEAHEKLASGSQYMVDYIDTVMSMMNETDATKLQAATETMMEQIQNAVNDMTEGSQLLAAAMQ